MRYIALIVFALALTACSSSAPPKPAGPPSASALAAKIPGCSQITQMTPMVISVQDVTCTMSDGTLVEIATFTNAHNEQAWIENGGTGSPPDPAYAGCCIEGNLWAATGSWVGDDGDAVFYQQVIAALGGRQVSA